MKRMLLNERDDFLDRANWERSNLHAIQYLTLVSASEPPRLNPRIGKIVLAINAKKQHAADGRHFAPLIHRDETQRLKVGAANPAY